MAFHIERFLARNRAPFDYDLDLSFKDKEITVLTGINGKGKSTIISYIMDSWIELTRSTYTETYKERELDYYRVSSNLFSIDSEKGSYVYIRFREDEKYWDYIDIRGPFKKEEYDKLILLEGKIPYEKLSSNINSKGQIKYNTMSGDSHKTDTSSEIQNVFNKNVITYFPSYRYEVPSYLSNTYQPTIKFNIQRHFTSEMANPLEVISDVPDIANWIMDIVIDGELYKRHEKEGEREIDTTPETRLWENLRQILVNTLHSKFPDGNVRFAIGKRYRGLSRISIYDIHDHELCPSIFNLSSGELALLCIFGEILRQADNLENGIELEKIGGIVLIDEIDKHLHIKLQKEVLPLLLQMFPNIQFIVSSHSPFLNMGLADHCLDRTKIIDLDNKALIVTPTNNLVYEDAYSIFLNERINYAHELEKIKDKLSKITRPLVITEGKTDIKHILKAMEVLQIEREFDVLDEADQPEGCSCLDTLIKNLSKNKGITQPRKIIAIFDRDVPEYLKKYPDPYHSLGNNIYAFCISCPESRKKERRERISIEYLYNDDEIHSELPNKTHLFFGNEFKKDSTRQCISNPSLRLNEANGVGEDRIIENNGKQAVYDNDFTNHLAKKNEFAEAIINEQIKISDESWNNFLPIIRTIQDIIQIKP